MKEIHILLVEDNEGDVILTLEALKEGRVQNKVSIVKDGWDAWLFLKKEGHFSTAETPDLILLDINLPKLNGQEVLSRIKQDEKLRMIPVIIFTTSSSEKDILDAYNNHANSYITKPVTFKAFTEVVHSIEDYWNSIVQLPKN